MNLIYYGINDKQIVFELKKNLKSKKEKIQWMETLVLIEPKIFQFKDIVNLLYEFLKEYKLDIYDFLYVYNFSDYVEDKWYCIRIKKKGLKRISKNFK